jgi:hypothetical protein
MPNYLKFEIFDVYYPDVHVSIDNEKKLIHIDYYGFNNLQFFTLISKASKYCRRSANNIYNYPIRKITTKFRGIMMTFDIHITAKEIHDYYLVFDEVFNSTGSVSIWDKLSEYPVIASPNSLSANNMSNLTRRSERNNELPISEYFSRESLDILYQRLERDREVTDYEINGYLTSDMMNNDLPREEMVRHNLGITAKSIVLGETPCVLCHYNRTYAKTLIVV